MSHEALSPQQFDTADLGHIDSRDHAGKLRDLDYAPGSESDARVQAIMESARAEGIREPLDVRGMYYLHDGHHRYVAARRLGIPVPVRGY